MALKKVNVKLLLFCLSVFIFVLQYIFYNHTNLKHLKSQSNTISASIKSIDEVILHRNNIHFEASNKNSTILFIHVPKSSGTSFSNILRRIQCHIDSRKHADCCHNPGSCHFRMNRRCRSIIGCVSHYPRSHLINEVKVSVAILREPTSRAISGWFYPGHNPNNDAFQVVNHHHHKDVGDNGIKKDDVSFFDYLKMIEYQNIQTRMLGANSFPYRNIPITKKIFINAVNVLKQLFFIALKEEFEVSALTLMKMMNISTTELYNIDIKQIPKERCSSNDSITKTKMKYIYNDHVSMALLKQYNHYDIELYQLAIKKFCNQVRPFPELLGKLTSIKC